MNHREQLSAEVRGLHIPSSEEAHQIQTSTVKMFDRDEDLPDSVKSQLAHLKQDVPNIALLYYGGTLGMKPNKEGHLVATDDVEALLKPLKIKGLEEDVNVVWFPVLSHAIDSTNGRWPHWVGIGNAIKKLYTDFPDSAGGINGFVVAGGTDTMAHLTAAMKYMFPNIGRPIITTGSQKSIFEEGSDAEANLYFSLGVAKRDIAGVQQAFGSVLREGGHIHKVRDVNFNAFECPRGYELGEFNANGIVLYDAAPKRNYYVTSQELVYQPQFREGVKVVKLSPATRSESILYDALDPTNDALLLITYGAGNVRDEGTKRELPEITHIDALTMLRRHHYPVVLGSAMMDGVVASNYLSGAKAIAEGVEGISAQCTTGASLEVKMMRCLALAYKDGGLDYEDFRAQMNKNHVGELATFERK
jgi:L-asparaginase/Glu-tRNA(Gln) amidotransferase subunit D